LRKSDQLIESALLRKIPPKKKDALPRRWNNLVKSQDEQYQLKRQAVIAEASRAFGHRGYQNVSLDDIAKSLNVTKPALYHYIKSKQELLYECHSLAMDIGDQALEHAIATGENGLEKLEMFISNYINAFASELAASAVLHELNAIPPEERKRIIGRRRQFDLRLRNVIQIGIDDKTIMPCDAKLAVFWFMGAINGIPRWFSAEGEFSGAQIAEAFVKFLVQGIQAQR
jgi:TetR/AcrR family transcriptional regulator